MEKVQDEPKYFLTVDWCGQGKRGIFCSKEGTAFSQDESFSEDRIWEILDAFCMVLHPQSVLLSESELKEYNRWYPLSEFSNEYSYAVKGEK